MLAIIRRKLEMGISALAFSRAHPDGSPGYAAALQRLEDRLGKADELAAQQRTGVAAVRASTARKFGLRREMLRAQLGHVSSVALIASGEVPELAQKFAYSRKVLPYLEFRTAARAIAAEAENNKELLVRYGLAESVLAGLHQSLDEFDWALDSGTGGRRTHVGASAELQVIAEEVGRVVHVMDGLNRFRFRDDEELLAAWRSASNTVVRHATVKAKPEDAAPAPN